jgi:excisionase family DNA binding protein
MEKMLKTDELLKASEVASILNISRAQAYILMKGTIPSIKFGKTVRVRKSDLENFIAHNMSKSTAMKDTV